MIFIFNIECLIVLALLSSERNVKFLLEDCWIICVYSKLESILSNICLRASVDSVHGYFVDPSV